MNRISKLLLAATVSVSMSGLPAQAADILGQLNNVTGSVLVERDGEFFRAETNSQVATGDRIIAIDGARADINLAMGCSVSLDDANTVTIAVPVAEASDVCSTVFDITTLDVTDPAHDLSGASLPLLGLALIPTLLAAAAVIAGIVIITDDDTPSSP